MSSTVFQELPSCLEPWLVEQPTLCLKLVSSKPHLSNPTVGGPDMESPTRKCRDDHTDPEDLGAFSSITSLANASQVKSDSFQTPLPLRRTSSLLSKKSLELCTESLGCETGTDIGENSYFPSPSPSPSSQHYSEVNKICQDTRKPKSKFSKMDRCRTFPPPLTSIAGGSCIHVKPHREEGRLVLKAITSPAPLTYFQAERSQGRLRLRLNRSFSSLSPHSEAAIEEEEEEKDKVENPEEPGEEEKVEEEEKEVEEEEKEQEEEDEDKDSMDYLGRWRIGKIERPSITRCNEREHGSKGVLRWGELFCVASS